MKKTVQQKLEHVMLIICMAAFGHQGIAQCEQNEVSFTGKEPTIDLTHFLKTPKEVARQGKDFTQFVKTGQPSKPVALDSTLETVIMSAMVDLYKKAEAFAEKNSITAVRITFGMGGNKMLFYYQPVYLVRNAENSFYTVKDIDPAIYYRNSGAYKFNSVSSNDVEKDFVFYQKNILIDQYRKEKVKPFRNEAISWRGDTRSLIFTFQELFSIYHNAYPCPSQTDRYCNTIAIHNGAANYRRSAANFRWRVKHTLYVDIPGMKGLKSLAAATSNDKAANLGHLCPPSCNQLTYTIED